MMPECLNHNRDREIELKRGICQRIVYEYFYCAILSLLLFLLAQDCCLAFIVFPMRRIPHPLYAPQEALIECASWANPAEIENILAPFGIGYICRLHEGKPIFRIKFTSLVAVEYVVNILQSNPLIKYAEPNFYVDAELIPNDPIYIYQWHIGIINTETAWDIQNGTGAIIAVLDTGVAYRNALPYTQAPDLAGTLFLPGWDYVNNDAYPDDDNGHGTHIVGTMAQTTNNLLGCAGIAYGSGIMPIKVLDANSSGLISSIVAGIYFAVDNGAHIINTSFGTITPSTTLEAAIDYAALNGLTIICSAGNGAASVPHYPSSYLSCISVSAIKYDKTLAFYSNYGADIDLCAPGGDIAYDQNLDGIQDGVVQQTHDGVNLATFNYYLFQGTSCAAAHVTGVAALIIGATGSVLGPDQVRNYLESTALDIGTAGWDQYYGWGLVNATASLLALPVIAVVASSASLQPLPELTISNLPVIIGLEPSFFPAQLRQQIPWTYAPGTGMPLSGYPSSPFFSFFPFPQHIVQWIFPQQSPKNIYPLYSSPQNPFIRLSSRPFPLFFPLPYNLQ